MALAASSTSIIQGGPPPQVGERPRQFHAGAAEGSGRGGADGQVAQVDLSGPDLKQPGQVFNLVDFFEVHAGSVGWCVSGGQRDRVMASDSKKPARGRPVQFPSSKGSGIR
jgi:hypothetical protein